MSSKLLESKIRVPIIRRNCIERPRLLTQLNGVFSSKLTFVSAPAGYGKTTILAQWAGSGKHAVAWVALENGDNDQVRFWTYVLTALKSNNVDIDASTLSLLRDSPNPSMEMVLTSLINYIVGSEQMTVLVLDDYHLITNKQIHTNFVFLLQHLPENLRIIIASRAKHHMMLGRLRAQGQLKELNVDDLRFTLPETATFFNNLHGTDAINDHIEKLNEQTEGWIAGLQLIGLSIKDGTRVEDVLNVVKQNHRYIADFLLDEVLNQQDRSVTSFLLQTSILERMCSSLCEAVTGNQESSLVLEKLELANLFTFPLDDEREWYRYHSLFKTFLYNYLKKKQPGRLAELHHNASLWYEQNDDTNQAVDHALAGGNHVRAADLIDANAIYWFFKGEMSTFIDWFGSLSEELIRSRPGICVVQAFTNLINPTEDSFEIVERRIADAEEAKKSEMFINAPEDYKSLINKCISGLTASLERERGESPQGMIAFLESSLKDNQDDDILWQNAIALNLTITYRETGDVQAASRVISDIMRVDEPGGFDYFKVYGAFLLAQMKYSQGNLQDAVDICQRIITRYENHPDPAKRNLPVLGAPYCCLGSILLEMDDLPQAEKYLEKGLALLKILSDLNILLAGYGALIRLKIAQESDFSEVDRIINEMERLGPEAAKYGAVLKIQYLWSQAAQGGKQIAAIALIVRQFGFNLDDHPQFPGVDQPGQRQHDLQISVVRFLISQQSAAINGSRLSETSRVMDFLDQKLQIAQERGLLKRVIQLGFLKCQLFYTTGRISDAMIELRQALFLAKSRGFFRIFLDEGESAVKILQKAVAEGVHQDYAIRLVHASKQKVEETSDEAELESSTLIMQQLSERELQILRLIAAGLSNREIAEELFLAVGTVKKHLYNIYGKLNVSRRTQAVSQAQKHALL